MPEINELMLRQLRALGIKPGACLLVHASYKSLGNTAGSPGTVIDTLMAAVGTDGTLLFPTLSYESVNAEQPYFDARSTVSCVGVLPEIFRKRTGVRRSIHPTHSVAACGRYAEEMTATHGLDSTPVGANSPFRKLRDKGGYILFLGCGLYPNTSMHGVEELAEPPYVFLPDPVVYHCVDEKGDSHTMTVKRHHFMDGEREIVQRYDRIAPLMLDGTLTRGKVLDADCYLLDARAMWDTAEAVMRKTPLYFVD